MSLKSEHQLWICLAEIKEDHVNSATVSYVPCIQIVIYFLSSSIGAIKFVLGKDILVPIQRIEEIELTSGKETAI